MICEECWQTGNTDPAEEMFNDPRRCDICGSWLGHPHGLQNPVDDSDPLP